jgi:hypothetical protein
VVPRIVEIASLADARTDPAVSRAELVAAATVSPSDPPSRRYRGAGGVLDEVISHARPTPAITAARGLFRICVVRLAPEQHFEQASVRAVEQGRYLVRAANTGISGVVDPYGRALLKTSL